MTTYNPYQETNETFRVGNQILTLNQLESSPELTATFNDLQMSELCQNLNNVEKYFTSVSGITNSLYSVRMLERVKNIRISICG